MKDGFLSRIRSRSTRNIEGYFTRFFRGDGRGADPMRSFGQKRMAWEAVHGPFEETSRNAIHVLDRMAARIQTIKVYGKKTQINAAAPQGEVRIHLHRLGPETTLVAVDVFCQGSPVDAVAGRVRAKVCNMARKGRKTAGPGGDRAQSDPPRPFAPILTRPLAGSAGKENIA